MSERSAFKISTLKDFESFLGESPILSASIRVTRECNLCCSHCYVYSFRKSGKRLTNELSAEEIIRRTEEVILRSIETFNEAFDAFARRGINLNKEVVYGRSQKIIKRRGDK